MWLAHIGNSKFRRGTKVSDHNTIIEHTNKVILAQDELGKPKEYSKDVDMKTSGHKTVIYIEGFVKQLEGNETASLDRFGAAR